MAQLPTYLKDTSLVCYYPLDSIISDTTSPDLSGNGHDLIVTNTSTLGVPNQLVGKFGNCHFFNPVIMDTMYSNSINVPTNTNSTISLWIEPTINVGGLPMVLFKSDSMKIFLQKLSNNSFRIFVDTNLFKAGMFFVSNTFFINFILKHESDSDFIFINGSKKAIRSNITSPSISKISFGAFPTVPFQSRFGGSIDDVAIWKRALSNAEIASIYTSSPLSANKAITKK